MLDFFDIQGPNGEHKCLVYSFLGPNIPDKINTHFSSGRLPGRLAKAIAKQALIRFDDLHRGGIGDGTKSSSYPENRLENSDT
jgi:hypothetical protein